VSERRDRELQDAYEGYTVYDEHYEKIGRVDDLFVDGEGREQYIGVKMGTFGMKSTLIPMDLVRVNDIRKLVEVAVPKDVIEGAPNFHVDEGEGVSADLERRIHAYFGDARPETLPNASDYFPSHQHESPVDTEFGERADLPAHPPETRTGTPETSRRPEDLDIPLEGEPLPAEPTSAGFSEPPPIIEEPPREDVREGSPATGPPPEDRGDARVRVHRLNR
jgi:hypothetical protein